jgi:hypothetical protein
MNAISGAMSLSLNPRFGIRFPLVEGLMDGLVRNFGFQTNSGHSDRVRRLAAHHAISA